MVLHFFVFVVLVLTMVLSFKNDNNLTFHLFFGEVFNYFGEGAADVLFKYLCQLAGHCNMTVGACCFGELFEGLDKSER